MLIKDIGGTSCSTISAFTNAVSGSGDADMTGARIYSDDGTSIVAAWGQVPGLNSVQPAIDMGTSVLPFPVIDLQKDAEIVGDDGDGLALPGDTIHYTIQAINRGIAPDRRPHAHRRAARARVLRARDDPRPTATPSPTIRRGRRSRSTTGSSCRRPSTWARPAS